MLSKIGETFDKIPGIGLARRMHGIITLVASLMADMLVFLFGLLLMDAIQIIVLTGQTHSSILIEWADVDIKF